ncbi:hypothetical protein SAMN05421776_108230 [Nocardia farcinica]|uniref:DUF5067 domain-containing protein n=2 Tax=Nocardia farcinica TaxID=37329 RepID=A0A0H5NE72_NOCFR|nr:hypothetical protein CJ469_01920 [Nocardia farcinica]PFX10204.1 hypothetical protein CJ468_01051 [Nocardia farcinica]CRY73604.1 Uncharacterised protein [Nocardia farcinica]SIT29674.1 hypothetical protein SAMN05421776_108230 [Nocardia farcinica]
MRVVRTAAVVAAVLALASCTSNGDDTPRGDATPIMPGTTATTASAATTSASPGVLAPTETGLSTSTGIETMIVSVEDVNGRYGPVTVFTFQLVNTGQKVFEGYNWPTPTVVYGPAGTPAEHTVSLSEGYGDGVQGAIPPGSRQTVQHAYKVTKAELNPAVVTVGSLVWQGDFAAFQR